MAPLVTYRHFHLWKDADRLVVRLAESRLVDEIPIRRTIDEVRTFMQQAHQKNLILDFADVVDLSKLMLNELMAIQFSIENAGGRLQFRGVGRRVRKIFGTMGLDHMFDIEADGRDASKALLFDRGTAVA